MNETIKRITEVFRKKNALFILGLCGILLIFLSDTLSREKKTQVNAEPSGAQEYLAQTKEQLEDALSQIAGAGEVRVFLTLEDDGFSTYAQNEKADTDAQSDADGASRRSSSRETEYVLSDGAPVLESSIAPAVRGVSVVCEGGDDITVVARITEFVSVGLGLPTNRICVTKMK